MRKQIALSLASLYSAFAVATDDGFGFINVTPVDGGKTELSGVIRTSAADKMKSCFGIAYGLWSKSPKTLYFFDAQSGVDMNTPGIAADMETGLVSLQSKTTALPENLPVKGQAIAYTVATPIPLLYTPVDLSAFEGAEFYLGYKCGSDPFKTLAKYVVPKVITPSNVPPLERSGQLLQARYNGHLLPSGSNSFAVKVGDSFALDAIPVADAKLVAPVAVWSIENKQTNTITWGTTTLPKIDKAGYYRVQLFATSELNTTPVRQSAFSGELKVVPSGRLSITGTRSGVLGTPVELNANLTFLNGYTPGGTTTYLWQNEAGDTIGRGSKISFANTTSTGLMKIKVKAETGDSWLEESDRRYEQTVALTFIAPRPMQLDIVKVTPEIITGQTFRVAAKNVQPGISYKWVDDSGNLLGTGPSIDLSPQKVGTFGYTLMATPDALAKSSLKEVWSTKRFTTIVYENKPQTLELEVSGDNPKGRAPVVATMKAKVSGGNSSDRVVSYSFAVDGRPIQAQGAIARVQLLQPGEHNVTLETKSRLGFVASVSKTYVVVENQAPVCTINERAINSWTLLLSTNCSDKDGRILETKWFVNDAPAGGASAIALNAKTISGNTANVRLIVTDDSRATTEVTKVYQF